MQPQNVETLAGDLIAALNRSDWDAALHDATPGIVFDISRTVGEWRGVYRGTRDVKRAWQGFASNWVSVRREIDEVIDGDGVAVARVTGYFEGRDGIEVNTHTYWIWRIEDGRVTEIAIHNDLDEALAAAGLANQQGQP